MRLKVKVFFYQLRHGSCDWEPTFEYRNVFSQDVFDLVDAIMTARTCAIKHAYHFPPTNATVLYSTSLIHITILP